MVVGLVQLQLPTVSTPEELAAQKGRIVELVGKARRNLPAIDLVTMHGKFLPYHKW